MTVRRRPRLRNRLSLLAMTVTAVAIIAVSATAWGLLRRQLIEQTDNELSLQSTMGLFNKRWDEIPTPSIPYRMKPGLLPVAQWITPDGLPHHPGFQSTQLPITAQDLDVLHGRQHTVRYDVVVPEGHFRVLTFKNKAGSAIQLAHSLSDEDATLAEFGVLLLIIDAIGIGLVGGLSYALTRAGLRPVDRIVSSAEQVASTQDLTAAVPEDDREPAETARIARSVNSMLSALAQSREQQRQLVEDASHELGTPLTSLRTNIDLLLRSEKADRPLSTQDRTGLLRDVQSQLQELNNLVEEVVDLARDPRSAEEFADLDLADVVRGAVARAQTRSGGAEYLVTAQPAPVRGQPAALERAVLNLLENAAKWSPASSAITVLVSVTGPMATLLIADRGPGVSTEEQELVFNRFYRTTEARALPGSGLGLAIVRQTAEVHGGHVWLTAREGGGTEAWLEIPAHKV
ncbi:sensor histidine kinase [Pseudonocardiaceae bacterium YIM PH 21723]|nr:sensor histidine kinase [Pseudonocardiaceae bacterium YIM PH 21723]